MAGYAAFLRAVNLGSTRKTSSADLKDAFADLGFEDAATFRTSGNVVFDGPKEPVAKMTARIEKGLAKRFGFEVPVFLRTSAQVKEIAASTPFSSKQVAASKGKLQVALLTGKPGAKDAKAVLALATDEDLLALDKTELYWLPRGGVSDSALGMKAIDNAVGPATIRTMGTIEQIVQKYFD